MQIEPCASCSARPGCTVLQRLARRPLTIDEVFKAVDLGFPRTEVVNWDSAKGEALLWCLDYSAGQ